VRVRGKYFAAESLSREENGPRKCVNFPRPMSLAGWRCHNDMSIPQNPSDMGNPCKPNPNPNRMKNVNHSIQKVQNREMKQHKYTKSLPNNQVCAIFHMRDIRKNVLPTFILKLCMETSCWCPFEGKPTETFFYYLFFCIYFTY